MNSSSPRHKRSQDILAFLPALFTSADLAKLVPVPHIFANRAVRRGDITRLMRGYYANSWKNSLTGDQPSLEQIACFLRRPSYISCEWAMNAHNILDQAPMVCTVVTLASSVGLRNRVNIESFAIEYSRIKEPLFWGYSYTEGAYLATPEKALLDTIYLRGNLPVADEINWEYLETRRLIKMVMKFPRRVRAFLEQLLPTRHGP